MTRYRRCVVNVFDLGRTIAANKALVRGPRFPRGRAQFEEFRLIFVRLIIRQFGGLARLPLSPHDRAVHGIAA